MAWSLSRWSCAYDDAPRPDSSQVLGEPPLDVADAIAEQREMALLGRVAPLRPGDVRRQPAAVPTGHHQVLLSLPDLHGHVDRGDVEAPRLDEGQVVVEPAVDARRESRLDRAEQELRELPGERLGVHLAEERGHRARELLGRHGGEAGALLLQ